MIAMIFIARDSLRFNGYVDFLGVLGIFWVAWDPKMFLEISTDMMIGAVGMQKKSVLYLLYNCFLFRVQNNFVLFLHNLFVSFFEW